MKKYIYIYIYWRGSADEFDELESGHRERIWSETGAHQGDSVGPDICPWKPVAYMDDVKVSLLTLTAEVVEIMSFLENELTDMTVTVKPFEDCSVTVT